MAPDRRFLIALYLAACCLGVALFMIIINLGAPLEPTSREPREPVYSSQPIAGEVVSTAPQAPETVVTAPAPGLESGPENPFPNTEVRPSTTPTTVMAVPQQAPVTSQATQIPTTPPRPPTSGTMTPPAVIPLSGVSVPTFDRSTLKIGVHASRPALLASFEQAAKTEADIVAVHIHWGNENAFPVSYAQTVAKREATLMVFWNPMDYRKGATAQSRFHFAEILAGEWDDYIDTFAEAAADYGGPVWIAPLEEANGYWTFWSGYEERYGTIEEYKQVFRYLRERFREVPNVQFAWVMNQVSVPRVPENAISLYYPGSDVVDIIGINAFNFGTPWISFAELVERPIAEVLPLGKPMFITSTASADGETKAQWIREFFASPYFRTGILKGFIWFNEDKERNWLITSDSAAARAFRVGVAEWRGD